MFYFQVVCAVLLILVHNKVIKTEADLAYCQSFTTSMSIISVLIITLNIIVTSLGPVSTEKLNAG
jgi:hypothetical protein